MSDSPEPVPADPVLPPPTASPLARAQADAPPDDHTVPALRTDDLTKRFGDKTAVDAASLVVPTGSFYGLVGPNGAGKTTFLSMVTGLLRPDAGTAQVHGIDVWRDPIAAKRQLGNLADGVRLFDRLTGEQLITYTAMMFSVPREDIAPRVADLLALMDLEDAAGKIVADYSAGMTKKVALACALVHAPRLLVLDEPFEAVDPVSAANIEDVLRSYTASGGTIIVSSHSMDLVQRMCDHVAIMANGRVLTAGTVADVRGEMSLQDRFLSLVGGRHYSEGPSWLRPS